MKDAANYELYSYEELGRGEPELLETGRKIITGQYSGISGFSHIMNKTTSDKAITFSDAKEAVRVLELARYVNVAAQKPLVMDGLLFIARYPEIAKTIISNLKE